jgi:glycerophosphoryl diester phosphodiesterase
VSRTYPDEPIGFAHRGAPGRAVRENTLPAFRAALRAGVPGIESDVWLTADNVPVLLHDGYLRRANEQRSAPAGAGAGTGTGTGAGATGAGAGAAGDAAGARTARERRRGIPWPGVRRRWLRALPRASLPSWIPSLEDLYAECGTAFELSLDLKDPATAPIVVAVARAAGPAATKRLWLCGGLDDVSGWRRTLGDEPHLVNSVRGRDVPEGVPARARALRERGIDVLNMHRTDWRPAAVQAVRDEGCLAFGWDVQTPAGLDLLLGMGCAGVYSDSVPLLLEALARRRGRHTF